MNPKALVVIILVGLIVLAGIVWLIVWFLSRQAGVRRAEFKRLQRERNLMAQALLEIETAADTYRDLESVLATQVRGIVRQLNTQRMELNQ